MKTSALWAGIAVGLVFAGVSVADPSPRAEAARAVDAPSAVELKDFDCGSKEKPCPMQGWMKTVMAAASGSGDGAKLGAALDTVASHPPPGFDQWTAVAKDGSAKAKKGDIDGAKETCKKCHDLYKDKYKTDLRDKPWP